MDALNQVLVSAKEKKAAMEVSGAKPPDPIQPKTEEELKEMATLLSPFIVATNKLQAGGVTASLVLGAIISLYRGELR